jgi:hypothetical protein
MRDTCETCGRKPVQSVTSTRQLGLIFWGRSWETIGLFCREHGAKQLRSDLVFSLFLGWWGYVSIFSNFGVVSRQLAAMRRLSKLAPPDIVSITEGEVTSAPAAPDTEA